MSKYRVTIVDDEFHSTELLAELISMYAPQLEVVGKYNIPNDALGHIKSEKPDLLFLDIEMPGINGFELLEKLGAESPSVIFITAYDKFAIKAIKFSAFDYLLKPVDSEELVSAIDRWVAHFEERIPTGNYEHLAQLLKSNNEGAFDRIVLSTHDAYEVVELDTIVRIESQSNYTRVFCDDRKPILIARTLKDFEETLSGKGFLRVHNSHLINTKKIKKFVKTDGGHLEMIDDSIVYVSKSKKSDVMKLFQDLL